MTNFKDPTYQDWIAHHGILGMKWGVRRYQNEDGTLTEKGKSRFKEVSENPKLARRMANKAARNLKLLGKQEWEKSYKLNPNVSIPGSYTGKNKRILAKLNENKDKAEMHYSKEKYYNTQAYNIEDRALKAGEDFITSFTGQVIYKNPDENSFENTQYNLWLSTLDENTRNKVIFT